MDGLLLRVTPHNARPSTSMMMWVLKNHSSSTRPVNRRSSRTFLTASALCKENIGGLEPGSPGKLELPSQHPVVKGPLAKDKPSLDT